MFHPLDNEIKEFCGMPISAVIELVKLQKCGRLLILPCNVGDRVYRLCETRITGRYYKGNGRPHQPCPFCIQCDCGGIATDISGYLPLPQKARLKKGMRYFAYDNSGNEYACGKETIY